MQRLEFVQLPGQLLWLPPGWWHATENLDDEGATVGIGGIGHSPGLHFEVATGQLDVPMLQRQGGGLVTRQGREQLTTAAGLTLAHTAARVGSVEALRLTVEADGGTEARDKSGATPLHWAAGERRVAAVEWLLDHGAEPNVADAVGCTPAHWSARGGDARVLEALHRHGASFDAVDSFGCSPAHLFAAENHRVMLRVLVDLAGDESLKAVDHSQRSVADWAEAGGHLALADALRGGRL